MILKRKSRNKEIISKLCKYIGVNINGDNPEDILVHDSNFYNRVVSQGSLGLGESYIDGWWDCKSLDKLFDKITNHNLAKCMEGNFFVKVNSAINFLFNNGSIIKSRRVVKQHYDLGNDLYFYMLGGNPLETENHAFMQYTCAYRGNNKDHIFRLREDQIRKLELVCKKASLEREMRVLELGSGFGGFANYSSRNYEAVVTGYNISKNQIEFSREWNKNLKVDIIEKDYRLARGKFDRVISIGLAEHANLIELMETAHRCLFDDGIFVLHTIGKLKSTNYTDRWIDKYIFPCGKVPSLSQLSKAAEGFFNILDIHNFGCDYDPTLMAWNENFQTSWMKLENNYSHLVDGKFKRMWEYYLLSCAGAFRVSEINPRAMKNQLFQIVLSKSPRRYISVR